MQIRIRNYAVHHKAVLRSVPDPWHFGADPDPDPDPTISITDLQDVNKKLI